MKFSKYAPFLLLLLLVVGFCLIATATSHSPPTVDTMEEIYFYPDTDVIDVDASINLLYEHLAGYDLACAHYIGSAAANSPVIASEYAEADGTVIYFNTLDGPTTTIEYKDELMQVAKVELIIYTGNEQLSVDGKIMRYDDAFAFSRIDKMRRAYILGGLVADIEKDIIDNLVTVRTMSGQIMRT